MKILIVDDNTIFLETIRKILIKDHHTIVTAVSGEDALLEIGNNQFDLILTDIKMPGLSGVELIKKIRDRGIDTPIIIITGYGPIDQWVDVTKLKACDYILKPFEATILRNKIKKVERHL